MNKSLFKNNLSYTNTAEEAYLASGLNWTVTKTMMLYNKKDVSSPINVTTTEVSGYKAIVRDDTQEVLSVVTDSYEPNQNKVAFDLLSNYSSKIQFMSAGSLKKGLHIYVTARLLSDFSKFEEEHYIAPFLFLTSSFDKTAKLDISILPVCLNKNVILYPKNKSSRIFQHKHTKNVNPSPELLEMSLKSGVERYSAQMNQLEKMVGVTIDSEKQIDLLLKTILNNNYNPDVAEEDEKFNVKRFERVKELFFQIANGNFNAYSIFEAVSTYTSLELGKTDESRSHSVLFGEGSRIMQNAIDCLSIL
jgi:phage/plasmid-like protein (TIGR03299 family)